MSARESLRTKKEWAVDTAKSQWIAVVIGIGMALYEVVPTVFTKDADAGDTLAIRATLTTLTESVATLQSKVTVLESRPETVTKELFNERSAATNREIEGLRDEITGLREEISRYMRYSGRQR